MLLLQKYVVENVRFKSNLTPVRSKDRKQTSILITAMNIITITKLTIVSVISIIMVIIIYQYYHYRRYQHYHDHNHHHQINLIVIRSTTVGIVIVIRIIIMSS